MIESKWFQEFPHFFVGMSVLRIIETNPRNVLSTSPIAASQPYRLRAGTFPPLTLGLLSLPCGGASGRSRWQPELRILPASAVLPGQADLLKLDILYY